MSSSFDIVSNIHNNTALILIFENNYSKRDVSIKLESEGFFLKYQDGELFFNNIDNHVFNIIKNSKEIFITEIDCHSGRSKGNAKHSYKAEIISL